MTPDGRLVNDIRQASSREVMYVCTRDFSTSLPGYDGEQTFKRGVTRVARDYPAVKAHPDAFAKIGTGAANKAIRSARSKRSLRRPATGPPPIGIRSRGAKGGSSSAAPWNQPPTIQTARPRAVRDDIYDLRTVTFPATQPEKGARELRDRAMRAIERAKFPHGGAEPGRVRDHLAELVDTIDGTRGDFCRHLLLTGSPTYRDVFAKVVRGGRLSREEARSINLSGETGGFLLPFQLDPTVILTTGVQNPLRAISRVEQTTTDVWKGVSSAGLSASYAAEGAEASDEAPNFAQPEVECHKADAWVPASYEIDQDFGDLEPQVAAIVARAKNELEATKLLSGSGTEEPFGLLTGATETVTTVGKGSLAGADVDALEAALPPAFLDEAEWLGNRAIFKDIRKLDAEGGSQRWVKLPGSGPELLDLPVNYLSSMTSTVESAGKPLIVGDFRYFLIVDRIGMAIKLIPDLTGGANSRPTGSMGVFCMWRNGAKVLTKAAFRVLKVG